MIYQHNEKAMAVMFIGNEGVVKELLFPEFQAILDGFVPMEEWASRTARAVYLEINSAFCVTAAVFFTLDFDDNGAIDGGWNLPLLDLARTAATGPDLGAGPIHMVCASQCPVALFQSAMWNPSLTTHNSHFAQIKKALKRNKLGIHFKPAADVDSAGDSTGVSAEKIQQLTKKLGEQYQKEMRDHMAQLLKDQRLQATTLTAEKDKAVNDVRLGYVQKIELLQKQLQEKSSELHDVQKRNHELKETIEGQASKIEGLREYFEAKLARNKKNLPEGDVATGYSTEELNATVEAEVAAATAEVKELLHMRDVELMYRKEHEEALNSDLSALRAENQELLNTSGDQILEVLSRKGVNFVTYQPGAGHITIPCAQVSLFLESPVAFTASYCGVSEQHYNAWLAHYQAPVCMAPGIDGEMCGQGLHRVTAPAEFIVGESNYCDQHNQLRVIDAVKT